MKAWSISLETVVLDYVNKIIIEKLFYGMDLYISYWVQKKSLHFKIIRHLELYRDAKLTFADRMHT